MIMFFDTETTGVPRNYKAPLTDFRNWPRMVQVAWLLTSDQGGEMGTVEHIIKPDGFVIPADVARVHGVTTEIATERGIPLDDALLHIAQDIARADLLIAHNMAFDEKILGAEFLRRQMPNHLENKPKLCTMNASTDFCRIPGRYGYKWPRLDELYWRLFREPLVDAHHALTDVRACARCYFEMRRIKVMTL